MAVETKYGRVTLEHSTIPDDEPVFVLRARDVLTLTILNLYRDLCVGVGSSVAHVDGVDEAIEAMQAWRVNNPTLTPGLEG
jgi:hypothetical protein